MSFSVALIKSIGIPQTDRSFFMLFPPSSSRHQLLPPALEDALRSPWCIDRGLDVGLDQLRCVTIRFGGLGVLGVGEEEVQVAVNGQDLADTRALILIWGVNRFWNDVQGFWGYFGMWPYVVTTMLGTSTS